MNKKRDKLQVIYDILKVIAEKNGKIKPTHILYKSNLSHRMMEQYLSELIKKKFIIEKIEKGKKTYLIIEKGKDYLNKYNFITNFIASFGLD